MANDFQTATSQMETYMWADTVLQLVLPLLVGFGIGFLAVYKSEKLDGREGMTRVGLSLIAGLLTGFSVSVITRMLLF